MDSFKPASPEELNICFDYTQDLCTLFFDFISFNLISCVLNLSSEIVRILNMTDKGLTDHNTDCDEFVWSTWLSDNSTSIVIVGNHCLEVNTLVYSSRFLVHSNEYWHSFVIRGNSNSTTTTTTTTKLSVKMIDYSHIFG